MRSTLALEINAPGDLVFELARNVTRWPALLPHYIRVTVEERHAEGALTARMVAVRPIVPLVGLGIPVAWRSRTWAEPDARRLRFVHRGGATDGMDVTWRIDTVDRGCRVSIEHDFRPRIRLWGVLVERLFVRPIAGRTLRTFKSIAEAVAASEGTAGTRSEAPGSEIAPRSNPST
jgi:ribosome-associated toxin RatA of RatAB toxin-antitoxin module